MLAASDSKGWVGGRVLDARERLVDGESARHMFGSLCLQVVPAHTVNKGQDAQVSEADDCPDAVWGRTHSSDTNERFCSRDFASSMMPDISLPLLVR